MNFFLFFPHPPPHQFSNGPTLRRLARKGEPFVWGEEQEISFQKLKGQVACAPVLAYVDKNTFTRVIADASPVGLEAVLMQDKG